MKINFKLLLPFLVGVFAVSMFVQSACAAEIDFQLPAQAIEAGEGVVTISGGNFSTGATGAIDVTPTFLNSGGLFGDNFDLTFNTATGAIEINGATEGEGSTDVFTGTITSFTTTTGATTETVNMVAVWNALPADVLTFFGLPAGTGGNDIASVGFTISDDVVNSVDVAIVATPEPATLLLFGSGLLGLGGLVRRKLSA